MLNCSQSLGNPLSYSCNWMAPTETNEPLTGYQLTCSPELDGIPVPSAVDTGPLVTMDTVSDLAYGVNYTCNVRARNEAGFSLPSKNELIRVSPAG